MDTKEKRAFLERHGFSVGARDPLLNTNHPGAYMVAEIYLQAELPTVDASEGPWCIVGDDLDALIDEAYQQHQDWAAETDGG